jgi:hypothetical protein
METEFTETHLVSRLCIMYIYSTCSVVSNMKDELATKGVKFRRGRMPSAGLNWLLVGEVT